MSIESVHSTLSRLRIEWDTYQLHLLTAVVFESLVSIEYSPVPALDNLKKLNIIRIWKIL